MSSISQVKMFGTRIKQLTNVAMATMVFGSLVAGIIPGRAVAASTPEPRVTFTFDDGLLSSSTQAAPTLAKYGYKGVVYATSSCIGSVGTCAAEPAHEYMTWPQLSELHTKYGWEVAAHTVNHPLLASTDPDSQPTALTTDQVISELVDSKSAILSNTGINTTDFATPYGDWTMPVLAQIAKYNASHRGFADSIDQGTADGVIDHGNTFPYNDYLLYDLPVQAGVSVDQVKSYIDQTITNKQWLIFSFHDIQPTASTDPDEYQYNTADLDAIVAYVKSKNLPVVTINEGLAGGTNLFTNAGFGTALSSNIADTTVWSTDDPTNIKQDSGNNGSFDGTATGPTYSVSLTGTTKNIELFSPRVLVNPASMYFFKAYLNVEQITVATGHEVAFYVDEFDAAGTNISTQYKKSEVSQWVENLNFEYKPTSATVVSARLQVVVTASSGVKAYLDNVGMYAQTPGGLGGGGKAGDVNSDNIVNSLDFSIMLSNWNKTGATRAQGDLSGDGAVTSLDFSILLTNWGK